MCFRGCSKPGCKLPLREDSLVREGLPQRSVLGIGLRDGNCESGKILAVKGEVDIDGRDNESGLNNEA